MRILTIGGTRFVGRHLVAAAVARGHQVTVLHRGLACPGVPDVEHLHADRDADLGVLSGREWDVTVDVCAYSPQQVTALAEALGDRAGRYALISTVSVHADAPEPGLDEQAPLVAPLGLEGAAPPVDVHTYGGLKVGCEHVARQRFAQELLVVRPTYVLGPYDPTGRFPYWVDRLARGGRVLCPGSAEAPIQYVDARDLGAFVVGLIEAGDEGTFNAVSPPAPYSFADMLEEVRAAVAPDGTSLEWLPSAWLSDHGVTPALLPFWTGTDNPVHTLAMDPARSAAAGLRARPLAETARDTLAWTSAVPSSETRVSGAGWSDRSRSAALPAEREQSLLSQWASR